MHCICPVAVVHVRIVSSSIEYRRFYMLWTMWLCVLYHPAPNIVPFFGDLTLHLYRAYPSLNHTHIQIWQLIGHEKYCFMNLYQSNLCFDCEWICLQELKLFILRERETKFPRNGLACESAVLVSWNLDNACHPHMQSTLRQATGNSVMMHSQGSILSLSPKKGKQSS